MINNSFYFAGNSWKTFIEKSSWLSNRHMGWLEISKPFYKWISQCLHKVGDGLGYFWWLKFSYNPGYISYPGYIANSGYGELSRMYSSNLKNTLKGNSVNIVVLFEWWYYKKQVLPNLSIYPHSRRLHKVEMIVEMLVKRFLLAIHSLSLIRYNSMLSNLL